MQVEVAILGPSFAHVMGGGGSLESPDFADQGSQLAWDERRRTVVEADETTTLADVINEAAERFEIRVPLGGIGPYGPQTVADVIDGIGFWREGDDAPDHFPLQFSSYLVGLDSEGRARWGTADQIRISDLVRAAERGVASFNPLRVYLKPTLPQGGEILIAFWQHFQTLAQAIWPHVEHAAALYSAGEFLGAVRRRMGKLPVLLGLRSFLEDRGAGAGQVFELLASRPWTPPEVAQVFDCNEEEAEDLLDLAGLSEVTERDRWEVTESKDAVFVRNLLEQLAHRATYGYGIEQTIDAIGSRFEEALLQAAETQGLAGVGADIFGDPLVGESDPGEEDELDL